MTFSNKLACCDSPINADSLERELYKAQVEVLIVVYNINRARVVGVLYFFYLL